MKRRIFLGSAVAGAGVGAGCSSKVSPWRFFTEAEAATLDAWVERLIPGDESPGAREAQVARYIDIQLTRFFKRDQKRYREALAAMEAASRKAHGKAFSEMGADQQTALLEAIEAGRGDKGVWGADGGKGAFEMVLNHAMQGFYGDPRHGGNKDYASWTMVGLKPVQVRGRLHYTLGEKG